MPTLQQAIQRARPGDTIELAAGTYPGGNVVPRDKHDIVIRGVDRNRVLLNGQRRRKNGILIRAAGVSVLNLSVTGFRENGVYWHDAGRYRGSYLTVWNVGKYGIYAEGGVTGVFDHDYVSGAGDAAYYVGECRPCNATIAHVVAKLSAVGYSGTNSSGVVIRDSVWDRNGAGILPNSYANDALPPEAGSTIVRNVVTRSGRAAVPIVTALAGFVGIGIGIAGGNDNVVRGNRVTGSERYGIAIFPTARYVVFNGPGGKEPGPPWRPRGNRVDRNDVSGSGRANLVLAAGSGPGNCFDGVCPPGDPRVAAALTRPVQDMFRETIERRRPPAYWTMPRPPAQLTMRLR